MDHVPPDAQKGIAAQTSVGVGRRAPERLRRARISQAAITRAIKGYEAAAGVPAAQVVAEIKADGTIRMFTGADDGLLSDLERADDADLDAELAKFRRGHGYPQ
jgi:hypothetical protein